VIHIFPFGIILSLALFLVSVFLLVLRSRILDLFQPWGHIRLSDPPVIKLRFIETPLEFMKNAAELGLLMQECSWIIQ
jgi:hypothetical protein